MNNFLVHFFKFVKHPAARDSNDATEHKGHHGPISTKFTLTEIQFHFHQMSEVNDSSRNLAHLLIEKGSQANFEACAPQPFFGKSEFK